MEKQIKNSAALKALLCCIDLFLIYELGFVNIRVFKFIEACEIELRSLVNILRRMEARGVTIESNLAA